MDSSSHPPADQSKQISITLNRDTVVNAVLAIQLGLLLVFGWQIYGIKQSLSGDTVKKVATAPSVAAADTGTAPAAAPTGSATNVPAPDDDDHVRGNKNATISLIEYSDFECPFCANFHPTAQEALDEYGDDVNWVFRHFPLSFHATAQKKAEASECLADLVGNDAFWNFADKMFANTQLPLTELTSVATSLGARESAFEDCLDSDSMAASVSADLISGQNSGVTGTPGTIVYNNETGEATLVKGAVPYSQLKAAIDSLL